MTRQARSASIRGRREKRRSAQVSEKVIIDDLLQGPLEGAAWWPDSHKVILDFRGGDNADIPSVIQEDQEIKQDASNTEDNLLNIRLSDLWVSDSLTIERASSEES